MGNELLFEVVDRHATVTINRPDKMNAMTPEMFGRLEAWFREMAGREDVAVVAMRAAGKHFAAGGDTGPMLGGLSRPKDERRAYLEPLTAPLYSMLTAMYELPQPFVVSVRGLCIGVAATYVGLADLAVGSETARFIYPQVKFGSPTLDVLSYLTLRAIGHKRAMEMIALGDALDARTAERYGLLNRVIPDEELDDYAADLVRRVAAGPAWALRKDKALLRAAEVNSFAQHVQAERQAWAEASVTDDLVEGFQALVARRPANFRGG